MWPEAVVPALLIVIEAETFPSSEGESRAVAKPGYARYISAFVDLDWSSDMRARDRMHQELEARSIQ